MYGRIGTCTQEFGTLASWLVDVLNLLTGNLDREGGAMFPLGAAGLLMGLISTTALAAHQIALQVAAILFMVPFGISMAATVRVGHAIGRGDAGAFNRSLTVKPEPGERGRSGHVLHTGNPVGEGDVFPALIVRVFGPPGSPDLAVNLKVQLDGADDYWATSRTPGSEPGQWSWPQRTEAPVMTGIADKVHYFSHGTPLRADGTQALIRALATLSAVDWPS